MSRLHPHLTHILIADASSLTVVGAKTVLSQRADTLITTASTADELLQACRTDRPDLILLGETLDPDHETLTLLERVRDASPVTRVLLIGLHPHGLFIRDAIALGALGYLSLLDDLREGLLTAVEFALRNRQYLSPSANSEYLIVLHQGKRKWQLDAETRSVLNLLVQGYSVADIAARMNSTVRHIYWVRDKLRARFGATTNEHLVSRAKSEGFCAEVE